MKKVSVLFVGALFFITCSLKAQNAAGKQQLADIENTMHQYAETMAQANEMPDRFRADSLFTRALVRALQVPNSFGYPFESLTSISRLYAPDSTFRIFTWQVMKDLTYYRQKGVIQMKTADGSLKIYPLFDASEFAENPTDSVRTNRNWIGAIYYNIIPTEYNRKKYYTLLGYDENDARSSKKWIEVLSFAQDGTPQFGGRLFNYANDPIKPAQPAFRFCLEYKKDGNAKLNYDKDLNMIIFAHLVSESGETDKKYTLLPLGTYEGFKWLGGRWVHQPVVAEIDPRSSVNPQRVKVPERQ